MNGLRLPSYNMGIHAVGPCKAKNLLMLSNSPEKN